MWSEERSDLRWFVPLVVGAVLAFVGVWLGSVDWEAARCVSALLLMLASLCLPLVLMNGWRDYTKHKEQLHSEHQTALSMTPVVLLAQAMRTMHPEAVRVLERFGVRVGWQVRVDVTRNTRTWVLEGTEPAVHFGFIEFVLSRSGKALYPLNRFTQGSRKWDPDGVVEDRDQHRALELWLFSRLMVTRSHGEFKPAEFIPPWTPELVMEAMGLTKQVEELYEPVEKVSGSKFQVPHKGGISGGDVPQVIEKALEGLEQTQLMKARLRGS